jgi:DDE superfamily endonuclease
MNQVTYNSKVAFTKNEIVACSCDCQAGNTVCVHILPMIYKLTQTLFEGLSEHLLLNFVPIFSNLKSNLQLNSEQNQLLCEDLKLLHSSATTQRGFDENIDVLLDVYRVGTDKKKFDIAPPNPTLLGPLRKLSLKSSTSHASNILNNENINEERWTDKNDNDIHYWLDDRITKDTYIQIYKVIQVFNHKLQQPKRSTDTEIINDILGHQILKRRIGNEPVVLDNITKNKVKKAINKALDVRLGFAKVNQNNTCMRDSEDINDHNLISEEISTQIPNKKRSTCCVYGCISTTRTTPNKKFRRVPYVRTAPLTNDSSRRQRILCAKSKYRRKIIMERFKITGCQKNKNGLEYCSDHYPFQNETINLPFQNENGEIEQYKTTISVPPISLCNSINQCVTVNPPQSSSTNQSKQINHEKCCVHWCRNTRQKEVGILLTRIPPIKKILLTGQQYTNQQRRQYAVATNFRKKLCISLGLMANETRSNLRYCNQHPTQQEVVNIRWTNNENKGVTTRVEFTLPVANATAFVQPPRQPSKGNATDRLIARHVASAALRSAAGDLEATHLLTISQLLEQQNENEIVQINQTILNAVGLGHVPEQQQQQKRIGYSNDGEKSKHTTTNLIYNNNQLSRPTCFNILTITDKEVKEQTGFSSLALMISFAIIIFNGNIEEMTTTTSELTWFEEILIYFNRLWMRRCFRWSDLASNFKTNERTCRRLFDRMLTKNKLVRHSWPRFTTLEEDLHFGNSKWVDTYKSNRIIMWDNTDISIPKPSDAEAQRLTYSPYYAGNVAKGSVHIQPSGWMGVGELYMGAVSDSEYMKHSKIFEYQQKYLPLFEEDETAISKTFVNILDKGYRITKAAWDAGHQTVLQPAFKRSDRKFTAEQTLKSAVVAADRAANERAVRLSKMSNYLNEGLRQNGSVERLCDVWLCWGFQCNFMYKPVH